MSNNKKASGFIGMLERIHTKAALTLLFLWELRQLYMLLFRGR